MTDNSDFLARYHAAGQRRPGTAGAFADGRSHRRGASARLRVSARAAGDAGATADAAGEPIRFHHHPRVRDMAEPAGRPEQHSAQQPPGGQLQARSRDPVQPDRRPAGPAAAAYGPPPPAGHPMRSVPPAAGGRPPEVSAASSRGCSAARTDPAAPALRPARPSPPPPSGGHRRVSHPSQRWAPRADTSTAGQHPIRHVQAEEVVKRRREPAEMGWRKAVYVCTGGLVNLGAGPHEQQAARLEGADHLQHSGQLSNRGDIGQRRSRQDAGDRRRGLGVRRSSANNRCIAIDADTTYGGLGRFVDPKALSSIRDFLAAKDVVVDYPKARHFTGRNKQGLEVLAGNQNVANPMDLDATTFFDTVTLDTPVLPTGAGGLRRRRRNRVLQSGAVGLGCADDHRLLHCRGRAGDRDNGDWLAARTATSCSSGRSSCSTTPMTARTRHFISHITRDGGQLGCARCKTIPWDPHLRDADDAWTFRPCTNAPGWRFWSWPPSWPKASRPRGR